MKYLQGHSTSTSLLAVPLSAVLMAACGGQLDVDADPPQSRSLALAAVDAGGREGPAFARGAARPEACASDPRVLLGQVPLEVCRGAESFFRETFGGNGRTCGSCHPVMNNFTIDVDHIASLSADDPLFIAEQVPELAQLERTDLLRTTGLILVNADGLDDPTTRFVMRSVSHTLSLATSLHLPELRADGTPVDGTTLPPNDRTGWSGDGAPGTGTLREFPLGAVRQHATRSLERRPGQDFREPSADELDELDQFQRSLGRSNEIDLATARLTDAGAERGRVSFVSGDARDCNLCHTNAGANNIFPEGISNFNFDIGNELTRPAVLNELGIPFDGGFGEAPFDTDQDGVPDSFGNGTFNTAPLIEAADTAPFFHANSAETLEEAIQFYATDAFGNSRTGRVSSESRPLGGPFQLDDEEVAEVGRLLRVLNAAFNCQQVLLRLRAVDELYEAFQDDAAEIGRGLLQVSEADLTDALQVLGAVHDLNAGARQLLRRARRELRRAREAGYPGDCAEGARAAMALITEANAALGSGMIFDIGAGTLLF